MLATVARPLSNLFDLSVFFREVNETPLLAADEEEELAWRIQDGDTAARDHMVRANLRLVIRIAKSFTGRGLSLEDLIQEGSLGLVRAAEGFDPARNTRFSTYAKFWIQQSMQRAVENLSTTVRVPSYALDLVTKWRRATAELNDKWSRTPSQEEVAEYLGLTAKQVQILQKALKIFNGYTGTGADLDDLLNSGRIASGDNTGAADAKAVHDDELRQALKLVDKLDSREASVIKLRFGLSGQEPMTLNDIGIALKLTRERVRQIEREALAKLRDQLCAE